MYSTTKESPCADTTSRVPLNIYGKMLADLVGYPVEAFSETDSDSYGIAEIPTDQVGPFSAYLACYMFTVVLMLGQYEN